jgi:hypothetical protein
MPMTEKDKTKAHELLALAAHDLDRRKHSAGEALFAKLLELNGLTPFQFKKLEEGIGVQLNRAVVLLYADGDQVVLNDVGHHRLAAVSGLRYNPRTQEFEGTERDDDVVPTPGERYPKRSAVSLVVQAIVEQVSRQIRPPEAQPSLGDINLR